MREYQISTLFGLPIVNAVISGPKGARQVNLLFDTGAALTQFHLPTLTTLGYGFHGRTADVALRGVKGPAEPGYSLRLNRVSIFGKMFRQTAAAAFNLGEWAEEGLDGLLGFDIIQKLHLEMDGPRNILRIV